MKFQDLFLIASLVCGSLNSVSVLSAPADSGRGHNHADHHHHHDHDHDHNQSEPESWHNRTQTPDIGPLAEQLYTCSMHPQVRTPNPNDRCPICGMALIPVPQDELEQDQGADSVTTLTLGARALALTGVRAEPVQHRSADITLRLPGRIEVDERRRHTISARYSGRIERLYVNTVGARVQRGDHLADIYSPELLAAQEELLQAKRLRALGSRGDQGYAAARDKLRLLGITAEVLDAIEAEGRVREAVPIMATGQGLVQSVGLVEGQYVQPGDALYQLTDLSSVWAILEAFESDLGVLEEGQTVTLTSATRPEVTHEGVIDYIDPWVDPVKRTAAVRVVLENLEQQLKPGGLVRAQVRAEQPPKLLIPASAPLFTGPRALVYVLDPERAGRFMAREVVLGNRAGGYYPVTRGLEEGELVVTQGALRIDSELQIRGRPSMMAPAGEGAPGHDHGHDHSQDHGGQHEAESGDHDAHQGHQHSEMEHDKTPQPAEQVDPDLARSLAPIFTAYDLAQQALADDRLEDWREATLDLLAGVEKVQWPEALHPVRASLREGRAALAEVEDLGDAGEIFYHHAQAMVELARSGLAPGAWHVAYCPMASVAEQEGAHWLQRSSTLSNPYFGHAMLRCGDMQELLEGHTYE